MESIMEFMVLFLYPDIHAKAPTSLFFPKKTFYNISETNRQQKSKIRIVKYSHTETKETGVSYSPPPKKQREVFYNEQKRSAVYGTKNSHAIYGKAALGIGCASQS